VLEVSGLEAGYGALKVVHGVSFAPEAGKITAVLGANGAGKSTTLGAISGTVRRFAGEVRLNGFRLMPQPEIVAARGVAHVPQGRQIFSELTVRENLLSGTLHLRKRDAAAQIRHVFELMPRLEALADRRGGHLSGGEQQMLAIGRAVVARPKVLMIDELSLGLAPNILAAFDPVLRGLAEGGVTILMVEQYATFAKRLASHVLLMAQGRITFDGPASELTEDALLRAAYLGAPSETRRPG
jgi:branched-chain amino acid transport system ATP-binding protein